MASINGRMAILNSHSSVLSRREFSTYFPPATNGVVSLPSKPCHWMQRTSARLLPSSRSILRSQSNTEAMGRYSKSPMC